MSDVIDDILAEVEAGTTAPLYLVLGEEFLVRQDADALVRKLLPEPSIGFNYAVLDGASAREIASELATLPMLPGPKVVLVRDPELLLPKKGKGDALTRARDAWKAGRRKEGARRVLGIAARAGWGLEQIDPLGKGGAGAGAWREELGIELAEADLGFLHEVAALCRAERISAPESDDSALLELFAKGLPRRHALVLVASEYEAKHPLIKLARDKGRVIDRKVEARLNKLDLSELVTAVLGPQKKRLGPGAEAKLKDRCGGNMRLVQAELDKLALYVEGQVISAQDVELLVAHTRDEEFFELVESLQKRDFAACLRYASDAFEDPRVHPLMLLGSITSEVRKLLTHRERATQLSGGKPPRSFDDFKARVFPKIEAELKGTKAKVPHPYAAFMSMQASERFTREELLRLLVSCAESDLALKLGGGRLVVERLLWAVCGQAAPWESGLATVRRDAER